MNTKMKPMSQEELDELKRQIGTPKPIVWPPQREGGYTIKEAMELAVGEDEEEGEEPEDTEDDEE